MLVRTGGLCTAAVTLAVTLGCSSNSAPGAGSGAATASAGMQESGSSAGASGAQGATMSGVSAGAVTGTGAGGTGAVTSTGASGSVGTTGASTGSGAGMGAGSSAGAGTSSGASSGSTSDGGSMAGSVAADGGGSLVQPIQRGNLDVYQFGDTTFTVDGSQGARITTFSMNGTNVLTSATVNAQFWGGTFWTSPQGDWWTGMVPPNYAPIDYAPYMMSVGTDSSITAVGATATFDKPAIMASVTKVFSIDLNAASVGISYTITNQGTATVQLGHWELARVLPGGLTFYPAVTANPSCPYGPIMLQRVGAYMWFDDSKFPAGGAASKCIGNAAQGMGWVAHVVPDPAGPLVLIRAFPDIPPGSSAGPGDGEVEIFVQADNTYEEIEVLGALQMIPAGQGEPWQTHWYLRRLPVGTMVTVGNQALTDFVQAQLP